MDSREAKEVLSLYRPGAADSDPRLAEAFEQVQHDPELAAWFEQYSSTQNAIRAKLKAVPIPATLRKKIMAKQATGEKVTSFPMAARISLAAAAAVVLCVAGWLYFNRQPDTKAFDFYRDRMARSVQRGYDYMQTNATKQIEVLEFFRQKGAPTNLVLSASLQQLPAEGGSVLSWNGQPVEMLCLNAGSADAKNDLWVFAVNRSALKNPPSAKPQFLQVAKLMTASWSTGDKIYLLVGAGTENDLEKFLE